MKRISAITIAIFLLATSVAYADRTQSSWFYDSSGFIYPSQAPTNVLISGTNRYLNFGTFSGASGYGFRDFGGTMQFSNSGGAWTSFGSGTGGGSGNVSTSSAETSGRIPFWTSTSATPATLSGGNAGFTFDGTKLTAIYASTTALTVSGQGYLGTLGIGTSSPSSIFPLDVQGGGLFSGNISVANITATGTLALISPFSNTQSSITLQGNNAGSVTTATLGVNRGGQFSLSTPTVVGGAGTLQGDAFDVVGGVAIGSGYAVTGGIAAPSNGLIVKGVSGFGTTSPSSLFALGIEGNELISGNLSVAGITATGTITMPETNNSTFFQGLDASNNQNIILQSIGDAGSATFKYPNQNTSFEINGGQFGGTAQIALVDIGVTTMQLSSRSGSGNFINSGPLGLSSSTPSAQLSIGMASTTAALYIGAAGSTTPSLFVGSANSNGFVGIGTSNPLSQFEVLNQGNAKIRVDDNAQSGAISGLNIYHGSGSEAGWLEYSENTGTMTLDDSRGGTPTVALAINGTTQLTVQTAKTFTNSIFGVGTSTPAQTLSVQGNVLASGNLSTANITATGTLTLSSLASSTVPFTGLGGKIFSNGNLTWDGQVMRLNNGGDVIADGLLETNTQFLTSNGFTRLFFDGSAQFAQGALTISNSGVLTSNTSVSFDNTNITSDGSGNLTAQSLIIGSGITLNNGGGANFAGSNVLIDSSGNLTLSQNLYLSGIPANGGGDYALCLNSGASNQVEYDSSGVCTPSSKRFKHDIQYQPSFDALSQIMQLKPATYIYNNGVQSTHLGLIAEDVASVSPMLASYEIATSTMTETNVPHGLDTNAFISELVRTAQQQQQEIDDLKALTHSQSISINQLNARLDAAGIK